MNLYEILQNPERVGEGMTHFERLFAQKIGGGKIEEIYGTLPLYYNGRGRPLTDYLISGNAVQDGTPSPDAPVDAAGSGVRTGNLIDLESYLKRESVTYTKDGDTFTVDMKVNLFLNPWYFSEEDVYVSIAGIMGIPAGSNIRIYIVKRDGTISDGVVLGGNSDIRGKANVLGAGIKFDYAATGTFTITNLMLNLGSTALPYEPYGYKLPLTVNGTEYSIHLGTVPTTRRVKKLVLTGEEAFVATETATHYRCRTNIVPKAIVQSTTSVISTHYYTSAGARDGSITLTTDGGSIYFTDDTNAVTVEDFKSYLAAQYAAGTPVTVWYVLAEPETAIVNEPLVKIGDYADTISFAQAGVTIPTVSGANVLDMTSPVKPSEVYIKGKGIKPTGYGQLTDVNGVNILDKDDIAIYVHGQ